MTLFTYKVLAENGTRVAGLVEAVTEELAVSLLRKRGLFIIDVQPKRDFFTARLLQIKFARVNFSDIVDFTRQLATIINSGIPITEALSILRLQMPNPILTKSIAEIIQEIEGGKSLSDALSKFPQLFSPTYLSLIRAGETSGQLDSMLTRLSDNLEKSREFQGRVKGALLYPMFIIVGMGIVSVIMILFVIPKLTEIYAGFNADLPLQTKILMDISTFAIHYWWVVVTLISLSIYGLFRLYKTKVGRAIIDSALFKLPVLGPLRKKLVLVEFTRTLGILIGAGVSLLDSLAIAADALDNAAFKESMKKIATKIEKGSSLSEPITQLSFFPPIIGQMIATGESTGHLDDTLLKLSHYFEVESDQELKGLTTVIEPIIMVILGVGVLILVWAVIAPIYNITGQIK